MNAEGRFWSKVQKTDACWLWTASVCGAGFKEGRGYGQLGMRSRGRPIRAHRFSWEIHYGRIPAGMFVLHKCDNRLCVRPDHLFLGTQADNMGDAANKGRIRRGQKQWNAKLTNAAIAFIRGTPGFRQKEFAEMFGVDQSLISLIINRKIWKHLS